MQAQENAPTILSRSTEEIMRPYAQYLIFGIDIATGIVIAISAAMAVIGFLKVITATRHAEQHTIDKETIRLRLARGMLLAIDLQVGSVILKAIIVPSFQELAMLAAIVGIKVVVGWSLSREVNRHHDERIKFEESQKRTADTKHESGSTDG
ncbi:MAG: DUF1622 domain-containing protein [Thermoproteota archaeon]|nr:DUF1622 domain-containing protein [Thermoproteota archaeon]